MSTFWIFNPPLAWYRSSCGSIYHKKEDAEVVRMDAPAEMWMLIDECNQHHGRTSHFYVFTFSKRKDALAFKKECNESSALIDVSGPYKMYQTKG